MNRRFIPLLLAAMLIGAAPHKPAPSAPGFEFSDWHVQTTQEFDYNWESGSFNSPGHILLTRPGSSISADHATGNEKQHQATLNGNVVIHDNNGVLTNFAGHTGPPSPATLTCDTLTIDGTTKTYVATGNVHFVQAGRTITADRAVMNGITHDLHLYGSPQHPIEMSQ
jgi:lipopolysaccharide assembly outer membrane protein LptD (OstA)